MSIRQVVKTVAVSGVATVCAAVFALALGMGPAGANTLTSSDGNTTLSTTGAITSGTPYSSGQTINVNVIANSTLSAANLASVSTPGCTGTGSTAICSGVYYIEECTDPGGLSTNLPTTMSGCESATDNFSASKSSNGSLTVDGYTVYDLPDTSTLGPPTMTGTCDVSPNECVLGIFATNPQSASGFSYPHLFSAPFQITVGDGLDQGDNPGDGTPEVPLAIGLPLAAIGVFGALTIRSRRRNRREAREAA
jgi:hypothetical protein